MIFGNIILVVLPMLLGAAGYFCEKKEQKALFSLICGAAVYFVSAAGAAHGQMHDVLVMTAGRLPVASLGIIDAPPAYLLILRICLGAGIGAEGFAIVQALLHGFLTAAYIYERPDVPYAGAAVFTAMFLPLVCFDANIFTAVLICLFSARYAEERRFFRAVAVIFIAACFDASVLLLIPVWLFSLIPRNYIAAPLAAGIAAAAVYFPDAAEKVTEFFGKGLCARIRTPLPLAVCACAAALILMLTAAMYRKRSKKAARLIPVFIAGSAISMAAVFVPGISVPAQAALAMSAAALAPHSLAIFRRFAVIMLPKHRKAADIAALIIFAVLIAGLGAYIVFSDCFGTSGFGTALFGEAG